MLVFAVLRKAIFRVRGNRLFGKVAVFVHGVPARESMPLVGSCDYASVISSHKRAEHVFFAAFGHIFFAVTHTGRGIYYGTFKRAVPVEFHRKRGVFFENRNAYRCVIRFVALKFCFELDFVRAFFSEIQPVVIYFVIAGTEIH